MVYKWAAAWAPRSAVPLLHNDEGKPLVERIGKEWDGTGAARDALMIPDLFYHYHKDAGYTVSMNSKTASILTRMDAAVGLTPHTVYWADGAVAERRYILTGFPNILPLDDKRSRYKRPNGWDAELHNTDDRFVFDCEKFRPHHVWRSRAISTSCFFASDALIDALKAAGATGLYAEQIQQSDGGQLTGPEYHPEHHIFWLGSFGHAVASKALDGNLEKVTLARALPEEYYWLRVGWRPALALGVPVLSDNVPTRWYYGSKERVLPGFWAHGGVLTVSAAFREIIENLEPEQHQFFPVDFVTKKGELIEKRFILVITRIVNCLDRARSGPNPSILWHAPIEYMRERIIDADKVSDIHLWLDHYYGHNNNCFVSYELARRFEKANPKNIRFSALRLNTA